jgi:hypothetical protein
MSDTRSKLTKAGVSVIGGKVKASDVATAVRVLAASDTMIVTVYFDDHISESEHNKADLVRVVTMSADDAEEYLTNHGTYVRGDQDEGNEDEEDEEDDMGWLPSGDLEFYTHGSLPNNDWWETEGKIEWTKALA